MNRIGKYVSLLLCFLMLTGCSGRELPKYRINSAAKTWQIETLAEAEMEREPVIDEIDPTLARHGTRQDDPAALNAEIIGVSLVEDEILDQDEMDEAQIEVAKARAKEAVGREKTPADSPKSVLYFETNREYLIETRVLVKINEDLMKVDEELVKVDSESIEADVDLTKSDVSMQAELNLDLSFPQTMIVDEFSTVACSVETPQHYHESGYTITTSLYDLELEYVQDSLALSKDGDRSTRFIDDQLTFSVDDEDAMHLNLDVALPDITAVKEYVVSYHVRTSLFDGQEADLELHQNNPIRLEAIGVVAGNDLQLDGEETTEEVTDGQEPVSRGNDLQLNGEEITAEDDLYLAALEWCLREDYSGSETIAAAAGDRIYAVVKVILPDWAVAHAAKNGLAFEWDATAVKAETYLRQARLRLKSCPANYGGDAIVYEITLARAERDHLSLASIVTDPITFWQEIDGGEQGVSHQLIATRDQNMSIHHDLDVDPDNTLHNITQLSLEGETARLLGNEFYVVYCMGVRQTDTEQD